MGPSNKTRSSSQAELVQHIVFAGDVVYFLA